MAAAVTREDLDDLKRDLAREVSAALAANALASEARMSDLRGWLTIALAPVTKESPWPAIMAKLVDRVLEPKVLIVLFAFACLAVGGAPAALMAVDRYLPAKSVGNVQINSNNEVPAEALVGEPAPANE
jgi:hypothetical protein